jgi:hypothetical protein
LVVLLASGVPALVEARQLHLIGSPGVETQFVCIRLHPDSMSANLSAGMSTLFVNTVDNAAQGASTEIQHRIRGVNMIVIVGLVVLLAVVIVGVTGVLTNAGPAHQLTENFVVFGYHVTGSTGTLFLFGIVAPQAAGATLGANSKAPSAKRCC